MLMLVKTTVGHSVVERVRDSPRTDGEVEVVVVQGVVMTTTDVCVEVSMAGGVMVKTTVVEVMSSVVDGTMLTPKTEGLVLVATETGVVRISVVLVVQGVDVVDVLFYRTLILIYWSSAKAHTVKEITPQQTTTIKE